MAISYGFTLSAYTSSLLSRFENLLENYGVNESDRKAAILKTQAECRKEFLSWTRQQAELIVGETADAAPQRSGNLATSIYTEPDGDDWSINANDEKVPYLNLVLGGRGPIYPRTRGKLKFRDTRYGWRPMSNLMRVTGRNAAKYPYTGNLRKTHSISKVGGAPAIDFPGEGMDRWQSELLPGQIETLRAEIVSIVQKNGGRVTSTS